MERARSVPPHLLQLWFLGFWALNSCWEEAHIFPQCFTASIWDCSWNMACLSLPLAGLTQFKRGLQWAESFLLEAGEGRGWELGSEHRQGAPPSSALRGRGYSCALCPFAQRGLASGP